MPTIYVERLKFNPNHDELGRFTSADSPDAILVPKVTVGQFTAAAGTPLADKLTKIQGLIAENHATEAAQNRTVSQMRSVGIDPTDPNSIDARMALYEKMTPEEFQSAVAAGFWHKDAEEATWGKMTLDERMAVGDWVGGHQPFSYSGIQAVARGQSLERLSTAGSEEDIKAKLTPVLDALDGAIEKSPPLPTATVVYRGLRGDGEALGKLQPGGVFEDKGYTAVTPHSTGALNFATGVYNTSHREYSSGALIVKIELPAGAKAYPMNGHANEGETEDVHLMHEMLLPRGFRGRIVSRADGNWTRAGLAEITVRPL